MIVLSVLISAIALVTLASSQRDAEAINIAGSLRMQSYRLGLRAARQPVAGGAPRGLAENAERVCVAEAKPLVCA